MRNTLSALGRIFIVSGLLMLLFVAYQLWGTGYWTARSQVQLKHQFTQIQKQYHTTAAVVGKKNVIVPPVIKPLAPSAEGQVEGIIQIPRIGLNMAFVEGTGRDDLKKGPDRKSVV